MTEILQQEGAAFDIPQESIDEQDFEANGNQYLRHLRSAQIGSTGGRSTRIVDGAMIVNDGTNDRILIGYGKGLF